jgi:hypothetical protein
MKTEYEILLEISNACAGSSRPQTYFEVAELEDPDDYVKAKHGKDWETVQKKILSSGEIQYFLDKNSVIYRYTFTE